MSGDRDHVPAVDLDLVELGAFIADELGEDG
jgi:hypothetical protein